MTPDEELSLMARVAELERLVREEYNESRRERREIRAELTCIRETWDEHQGKYGAFLDLLLERESSRKKVNAAIVEKSLGGLIWGAIVFIGVASWEWMRNHVR